MMGLRRAMAFGLVAMCAGAPAQAQPLVVDRNGSIVSVEPYAPGIVRVTIALERDLATAEPGYGISARPADSGWTHSAGPAGDTLANAGGISVEVAAQPWPRAPSQMERYFVPSLPPVALTVRGADGRTIVRMTGWERAPQTVNGEKTFKVGATFAAAEDEHFYGLGQNQEGILDLRGRTIDCRHYYDAPAGEQVCVPMLVSSKGYAIVWDNPSPTIVSPGMHASTRFQSQVGERVSFFVITGAHADDIYAGYRALTGVTPLPPKAAFGLIQSKARYESQQQLLDVANGYRSRNLPLDVMVLDWFYWTRMGQLDIDRTYFPDPAAMNATLHGMGLKSMISVWPRFAKESRYFDMLAAKGWLLKDAEGKPVDGLAVRSDRAGALLDSTNPDARAWFWQKIHDNIASQGFDYFWLDETEPDLVPDGYFYSIGSGDRYHNLFPLVHVGGVAEGAARDFPDRRTLILARAAYLGAQRNGAIFWSSDVDPSWDALRRQIPTGLNFTASGLAYWGSDTGGWQWPGAHTPGRAPLIDPAGATAMGQDFPDYPELFVRWFEYATFTPTLRIHGQRPNTELWTYGKAAEPVLAQWLKLRYSLIPYLYALGRDTYEDGAPFMRALWMDFPGDPGVATIGDEYMFGPAFLVAPVTEQGATQRQVYLPAGNDWYDWWTNERIPGGRTITAAAPIDKMPLYVRGGSIVPLGAQVPSTATAQRIEAIRVYPGRDASFALYDDDGVSNAYKKAAKRPVLHWDDRAGTLTGTLPNGQPIGGLVQVIGK